MININGNREQIDPAPIDFTKVYRSVIKAVEIVIEDSECYCESPALKLFFDLSNDERIVFQTMLKSASPTGTRKSYYSVFKDHLRLGKENRYG